MPVPRPTALNIDEFEKSQIAIKTNKQTNKQKTDLQEDILGMNGTIG